MAHEVPGYIAWSKDITPHKILVALGYNPDGTIRKQWSSLDITHKLFGSLAYKSALAQWEKTVTWLNSPEHAILRITDSNRERLAEIEAKIDKVLEALEQRSK